MAAITNTFPVKTKHVIFNAKHAIYRSEQLGRRNERTACAAYKVSVGKIEGKCHVRKYVCRWEDIKIGLEGIVDVGVGVDWVQLPQHEGQW
jgi:hypothetical protein